jgi:lipopolysaccharide biosynthesis regulator YciM
MKATRLLRAFGSKGVIDRLKELFRKDKGVDLGSYLKKLSVNRQDLIKSVREVDVDSPINAYLTLAILLKEKGEYYKSLKILEKLKGGSLSQEEERLVILNLALVYRAAGFVDRAEEALKEGIKRFPDESFFYYELARIKRATGRFEEAAELLEKAASLKEEFYEELLHTNLYLADKYIDEGRTDKAFRILRKLNLRVPVPLFYYVLSKLYYSVGEKEKGYRAALKGIKLSPNHVYPFLQVFELFKDLTEERLREIFQECGPSLPLVSKMAQILQEKGKKRELLELLDDYCSSGGKFNAALFELYLRVMWELGRRKQVVDRVINYLNNLKEKEKLFKCENCGYRTDTFDWVCPRCKCWETLEISSEV